MADLLEDFELEPMLPAEGVRFDVTCRVRAGQSGTSHAIEVSPEWEVTTPHDLELERINIALGGVCSCVDLVDRAIPAARDLLEHVMRRVPYAIERRGDKAWRVTQTPTRCACAGRLFPSAAVAAAHLRQPGHWARMHDARTSDVARVLDGLLGGGGSSDRCPLGYCAADSYLAEPSALDTLWAAGVHFARVPELVGRLTTVGVPQFTRYVLWLAYAPATEAWFVPFEARGSFVRAWAERTRTPRDELRPLERVAWLDAGAPLDAVANVFRGLAYTLADAHALASATGMRFEDAAVALGYAQASGRPPALEDLVNERRSA